MDIVRRPGGIHRVERVGPGGRVVVTNGVGHGYIQRPFRAGNREFVQRTYYVRGVPYTRVYRSYYFGGAVYSVYTPSRFYVVGFYDWAYTPWPAPVVYEFGWRGHPWYGYYGGYYAPYPAYPTASLWLTDYYMGATLQAAYQERMAEAAAARQAPPPADNQAALPPDVKNMIAEEVQRQLLAAKAEAASASGVVDTAPAAFSGNTPHIFVVATGLDISSQGQQCAVTEGDVLQTRGALPMNSQTAEAVVLASKGQDCPKGSGVSVPVQDLVDMQNHMRETIDQGLADLQSRQGKGGLPIVPAAYISTPKEAAFVSSAPSPEQNVVDELSRQAREANQAEQEVLNQALSPARPGPVLATSPGPAPAQQTPATTEGPATVSLGQSPAEVEAILGRPKQAFDVGVKKIYVYKDLKITFLDGKVSDVQ